MELSDAEREHWFPSVVEAWLANGPKGPKSPATRRAYLAAWDDFAGYTGKPMWRVVSEDVRAWVLDMQNRPVDPRVAKGNVSAGRREQDACGLGPATIKQRLNAVSSLYAFASRFLITTRDGHETPFYDRPNPTRATTIPWPYVEMYGKTPILTLEQVARLLAEVRAERAANPLRGSRDYALFLTYLSTAGRSQEVRCLRWGDITVRDGMVFYAWRNKGRAGVSELPGEAWAAITAYLAAARDGALGPDDYIFTPLSDNALRFGRIDPAHWNQNRPLSAAEVNRLLRQYCKRAGIEAQGLHCHSLRHTAAMLQLEAGASVEDVSQLLHHADLKMTTIYLRHRRGNSNPHWRAVAGQLGV